MADGKMMQAHKAAQRSTSRRQFIQGVIGAGAAVAAMAYLFRDGMATTSDSWRCLARSSV